MTHDERVLQWVEEISRTLDDNMVHTAREKLRHLYAYLLSQRTITPEEAKEHDEAFATEANQAKVAEAQQSISEEYVTGSTGYQWRKNHD